jgi:hypothetical protein
MNNATISIFQRLIPEVSDFVGTSINELINDRYGKYFSSNNFTISNIKTDGFAMNQQNIGQKIEFDLTYRNPDTQQNYTYHFLATKGFYGSYKPKPPILSKPGSSTEEKRAENEIRGFIVRQFIRLN